MASLTNPNPNPTTPPYPDPYTYAHAYLAIHTMSSPSYRYAYLLWFAILLVFLIFALLHWTGGRGGAVGALWSKWTLRRRTWRKKRAMVVAQENPAAHRQPFSFPSNAQLLSFIVLTLLTSLACFAGPDYIAPSARLWQFNAQPGTPLQSQPDSPPNFTIHKEWWTVGGRTGIIAFSLFPLVVLLALKTPPFALLALPFLLQMHFDKLSRIHRWSGILVWIISTIHVATWGVQLGRDKRVGVDNKLLWNFVWGYNKFIYGCAAYFCLTLLILLSLPVIRRAYYEAFYSLHVLLIPMSIAMAALHFPPISRWCWAALGIWAGERVWRFVRFGWFNGWLSGKARHSRPPVSDGDQIWEMGDDPQLRQWPPSHSSTYSEQFDISMYAEPGNALPPGNSPLLAPGVPHSSRDPILPGFGRATLLPGRTIRLEIVTHRPLQWSPGQHVLLRIPSVSRYTTHPFTIASVCHVPQNESRQSAQPVELLVRAKSGFTRDLWNEVSRKTNLQRSQASHNDQPGVLLRAQLDGPLGSVSRTRWGNFSSVLIVAGGSGASFGIAILEFLCLCMSGQRPSSLGSSPGGLGYSEFRTRRIRFVWLVREYSHLQWCASALYRCRKLVPSDALQLDIFVTNISRTVNQRHGNHTGEAASELEPPTPGFVRTHNKKSSWASVSVESDDEHNPPITPTSTVYSFSGESDLHPLDLTNFDGDDDSFIPGEAKLSYQVHKEGHLRRRETRRLSRLPLRRRGNNTPARVSTSPAGGRSELSTMSEEEFNPYVLGPQHGHTITEANHSPNLEPNIRWESFSQAHPPALVVDAQEALALSAVSEMAHGGKPPLQGILREEVELSQGPVGVACCGPTSLNALVRKLVAAKIDPGRVRAGDLRGSIALISEEFDY